MLEQQIEQDLKTALLTKDEVKVRTLRSLKATLLNVKVATGKRASGLTDEEALPHLSKQSKQRQESADMYQQAGETARAEAELAEKAVIDSYLPAQLSEAKLGQMIDEVIQASGVSGMQAMGQVIGQVKAKAGAQADGSVIARLTKEKLS